MQRISIIGCCGSGKSTLARQLGELAKIPIIHLDKEFWNSGWIPTEQSDFRQRMLEIYDQENWIIDGHYFSTLDARLKRSDTVYYLDYPTHLCLYRALKRVIKNYGKVRPDIAEGCPERFSPEFIIYLLKFRKTFHKKTLRLLENYPHLTVHYFRHPNELATHLLNSTDHEN